MKALHLLLVSFLFFALAPASRSVTIWDNGTPNQSGTSGSDFAFPVQSGDDFTLAMTATAGQIQWWGAYLPNNSPTAPDDFTIRFFTITAGVPATVPLFSYAVGNNITRMDSGLNVGASDIYVYSAIIPDTPLPPGSYLLSIVNNTALDTNDDWAWAASTFFGFGTDWVRFSEGGTWNTQDVDLAFNISGEFSPAGVPDTGTSALFMGLGFIAILVFRRGLRGGGERRRLRTERSEIARLNRSNLLRAIDC